MEDADTSRAMINVLRKAWSSAIRPCDYKDLRELKFMHNRMRVYDLGRCWHR